MTDGPREPIGCSLAVVAVNILAMGSLAAAFATGSYSSWSQDAWYRGGSLLFLLGGAILPGIGIVTVARNRHWAVVALTLWMVFALALFVGYLAQSGGGM